MIELLQKILKKQKKEKEDLEITNEHVLFPVEGWCMIFTTLIQIVWNESMVNNKKRKEKHRIEDSVLELRVKIRTADSRSFYTSLLPGK